VLNKSGREMGLYKLYHSTREYEQKMEGYMRARRLSPEQIIRERKDIVANRIPWDEMIDPNDENRSQE
jgi:hypothetical protein